MTKNNEGGPSRSTSPKRGRRQRQFSPNSKRQPQQYKSKSPKRDGATMSSPATNNKSIQLEEDSTGETNTGGNDQHRRNGNGDGAHDNRYNHHHHHKHQRNHHHNRNDVVFPPDMTEKGIDVVNRIFQSLGLSDEFPKACQQQVRQILARDPIAESISKRKHDHEKIERNDDDDDDDTGGVSLADLTNLPYITIDNDHSMDLDQAMYICHAACPPQSNKFAPHVTSSSSPSTSSDTNTSSDDNQKPTENRNDAATFQYPAGDGTRFDGTTDIEGKFGQKPNSILVSYALADGAYFVPALSPLFDHALRHGGTSFYLPGKAIPMLPRELSEDMMSLNPNVKRRALVFDMYLNLVDGQVIRTFYRYGVIQSRWKGTYREVSEYYAAVDNNRDHWIRHQSFRETVDLLRTVGQKRIALAKSRNVVQYNRDKSDAVAVDPETGMLDFASKLALRSTKTLRGHDGDISDDGIRSDSGRYVAELYNEQISLLCNTEGAQILAYLYDQQAKNNSPEILHPIYRTQSGPRADQTRTLERVIANTLKVHSLPVKQWGWNDQDECLASYLNRIRCHATSIDQEQNPQLRSKWLRVVAVINRQAQITNQAASFSSSPEDGHHALKMTHYARFSSPMRELVGCYTHLQLYEAHIGRFSHEMLSPKTDTELRNNVIRAAQRSKEIQKRLSSMVFLHMLNTIFYKDLQRRINQRNVYHGVVMGMDFSDRQKSRRVYVQLQEPRIEIKVYGEDLDYHYSCRYGPEDGDTYNHRGSTVSISPMHGSFRVDIADEPPKFHAGDPVSIRVGDYAQFYGQKSRSRWVFIMLPEHIEKDESTKDGRSRRKSLLRNSLIDRELSSTDIDELSTLTSFSEHSDDCSTNETNGTSNNRGDINDGST